MFSVCLPRFCANYHIISTQASDDDAGANARLTYTISPGVADRLDINRTTGAVTLSNKIRLGERLEFTVTATDSGQTSRYEANTI